MRALVLAGVLAAAVAVPGGSADAAVPSRSNPASVLARMTEAQRVGQLVMVSPALSGVTQQSKDAITRSHVGSVFLSGRSSAGVSCLRSLVTKMQSLA